MDSSFSVWDIKLNLSGLSQHRGHVWSYVRAYQCVEDVSEIPLFQRHVLHSTPLPFPLCPQERPPAVFLVFIEQEVDWTGWPGSVFRRLVAETGLGPEPIVLYLATTEGYFCYCCLILSDIVRLQQKNVCVRVPALKCLWSIEPKATEEVAGPHISTEIVLQLWLHCEKIACYFILPLRSRLFEC